MLYKFLVLSNWDWNFQERLHNHYTYLRGLPLYLPMKLCERMKQDWKGPKCLCMLLLINRAVLGTTLKSEFEALNRAKDLMLEKGNKAKKLLVRFRFRYHTHSIQYKLRIQTNRHSDTTYPLSLSLSSIKGNRERERYTPYLHTYLGTHTTYLPTLTN